MAFAGGLRGSRRRRLGERRRGRDQERQGGHQGRDQALGHQRRVYDRPSRWRPSTRSRLRVAGRIRGLAGGQPRRQRRDLAEVREEGHGSRQRSSTPKRSTLLSASAGSTASARRSTTTYYLQRYTPRRARSKWSKINVGKVEALIAERRDAPRRPRRDRAREGRRPLGRRLRVARDDRGPARPAGRARPRPGARGGLRRRSTARTATRSSIACTTPRSPRRARAGSRSSSRCSLAGSSLH